MIKQFPRISRETADRIDPTFAWWTQTGTPHARLKFINWLGIIQYMIRETNTISDMCVILFSLDDDDLRWLIIRPRQASMTFVIFGWVFAVHGLWSASNSCAFSDKTLMGFILNLVIMVTSSKGNIFGVTGNSPVTGEFPAQRPATRSFDVFLDQRLNKRLSKQSWCW